MDMDENITPREPADELPKNPWWNLPKLGRMPSSVNGHLEKMWENIGHPVYKDGPAYGFNKTGINIGSVKDGLIRPGTTHGRNYG